MTPSAAPASRRSSSRWAAPERSGTRAGKRSSRGPAAPEHVGPLTRPSAGSCLTPTSDPTECHDLAAERTGRSSRSSSACGGSRPGATRRSRWRTATPSRSSPPERPQLSEAPLPLRLLPRRGRGARVGRPRTSATAHTPSPPRSTSTPRRRSGVLFSQGSRFGGHALYIKDGQLKYAYNWRRRCSCRSSSPTEPVPTRARGPVGLLRAGRRHDAHRRDAKPAHPGAEGRRGTGSRPSRGSSGSAAGGWSSGGRAASRSPTTTRASAPWAFAGGTIHKRR